MSETPSFETTIRMIVRQEIRAALDERTAHEARRNGSRAAPADRYLSIASAAALAEVAPGTLRRWIKEGRLPPHRAGRVYRIARADLDALLAGGAAADVAARARAILDDAT